MSEKKSTEWDHGIPFFAGCMKCKHLFCSGCDPDGCPRCGPTADEGGLGIPPEAIRGLTEEDRF